MKKFLGIIVLGLLLSGNVYAKIANQITNSTRKKFPVSWVFKILNHEDINSIVKLVVA